MSKIVLADGRVIEDFKSPYFIAEVNSSHNGNFETAKKMIDVAIEAGCDCVKFQSWSEQSLYSQSYYKENPITKRFVKKLSLSSDDLGKLAGYCRENGIEFSSTAYSKKEVDFLVDECKVPFIKVSSMEINNLDFLEYIANKNVPIVLSTGMAEIAEIKKAIEIFESCGNENIAILHCVSLYPTPVHKVNLNNILGLRERFCKYPVGFSDHTLGDTVSIAATALGAAIIEKHITLDSKKIGMDNQMAMEPNELKVFVQKCKDISVALGKKERIICEEEFAQRNNMRRSIVTTKYLEKNHIITREDIDYKRPGTGIPPEKVDKVIGKALKYDMESDILIQESDLK